MAAKLDVDSFRKLLPLDFHEKFLAAAVRPDGRGLLEFRAAAVSRGVLASSTVGSALVRVGETAVMAGVKAEVGPPAAGAPSTGMLVVNAELPPLCSPDAEPGRPSDRTQVLTRHLNEVLLGNASGVALDALCIEPGVAVWVLYLDVIVLDDSGSLDDAALLAAVAALASFELPAVDVDAADGQVYVNDGAESRAMDIGTLRNVPTLPLSFTFGLLGSHLIADPTASEEVLLSAKVGIVLDGYSGNVLATVKTGKAPLSLDAIAQCVAVAQERAAALVPLLS
ncbi:exosome complex exonuclease RRP43 [Thecamonas trahens ATCC 50062]|uniref:Ribosomal RNA-processing protein 43 n=1 Tax=Thecamonas trahens ATCC 50062 TaxID=461836 RepID=A0A0L0DBI8_THETB|nr:exosome complex exonuclease RRP43 [Thecamonas trahens ATCC 50062]KNC49476.1 exosome complex exonuclease RRP43 [Thecamonas trahens ATCC 50062]|eukprot:XP_013757895.1 exosome complex exonuclease RRP43 [Thecamonas trahens ATCC 50062]